MDGITAKMSRFRVQNKKMVIAIHFLYTSFIGVESINFLEYDWVR